MRTSSFQPEVELRKNWVIKELNTVPCLLSKHSKAKTSRLQVHLQSLARTFAVRHLLNLNHTYHLFQGKALESESCGNETGWNCQLFQWEDSGNSVLPAELPEVKEEIGPGCRCGCVVHLGAAKPRRMLATSTHSCPGLKPTMWLIKVIST